MNILITGAAGFIGQHLSRELKEHGHRVIEVDRQTGDGDFTEVNVISSIISREKPDVVVHLAAQVGRIFGEDDVIHTINSNAIMTTLVARACYEYGARMVYASTSEVYGDQGEVTCVEDGDLRLSHNLYGVTKFWGEQAAALYVASTEPHGLQTLRLSMPYGPGMVPGRGRAAIINMLWQANTGQRIPVHAGAERAWCWVGDTVRGIRLVIEEGEIAASADEWQRGVGCYNIGRDDNPISMLSVARKACEIAGARDLELIELIPAPPMQTVVKRLSNRKLRELGWAPTVEIDEGMLRVFEEVRHFNNEARDTRIPIPAEELGPHVSS